ncbi:MAG TPA: folate-binding protein, partial [Caulobacterales bacterium]|nr:folate-binding protein [Caulobacterales bacterium]
MALDAPVQLDRALIPIRGPDAEGFLQNLLTQDMARLGAAPAVYAGLLTPQGKVAFDFILWRAGEGYVADIHAGRAGNLIRQLMLYRLRAKVEIGPIAADQGVWAGPAGETADPRRPELGARWLARAGGTVEAEPAAYRAHRIGLGVPDLAHDGHEAESFALEALFEELNGVDFQ